MTKKYTRVSTEQGVALMMILWVMMLLDIIVLQFASSMRIEGEIARNFRDRIEAYYLARSGIEMARLELMYVASKTKIHSEIDGRIDFRAGEEDIVPITREVSLGRGTFSYEFYSIESKHNLNDLAKPSKKSELEEVLEYCGIEPESAEMSQISSSIMDWRDKNHETSGPDIGAEDEWYKDNWKGYECKDDEFSCVNELEMIRGLRIEDSDTEEERERKRMIIKRLYSVVDVDLINTSSSVNENFVSEEYYLSKGMDSSEIEDKFRQKEEQGYITSKKSDNYDVKSTGHIHGSIADRQIVATFNIKSPGKAQLFKWIDTWVENDDK
ncbi:MAG: general secretion pathway protein GspK [bacterium]